MLELFGRLAAAIRPTMRHSAPWTGNSLIQVAEIIAHAPADNKAHPRTRSSHRWVVVGSVLAVAGLATLVLDQFVDPQAAFARVLGALVGTILVLVGLVLVIPNLSANEFSRVSRFIAASSPVVAVILSIVAATLAIAVASTSVAFSTFSVDPLLSRPSNLILPAVGWAVAIGLATVSTSLGSPLVDVRKRAGRRGQVQRNTTVVAVVVASGIVAALTLSQPLSGATVFATLAALASLVPLSSAHLDRKRIDEAVEQMRAAASLALSAAESASRKPTEANVQVLIERLYLLEDALSASSTRHWKRCAPVVHAMVSFARAGIAGVAVPARLEGFRSHLEPLAAMTTEQRLTATSDFIRLIREQLV